MPIYKRLRLRLFASQFVVAFVGVGIMMLATRIIIINSAPVIIRPLLVDLIEFPELLSQTEEALILAFRNAVILSVLVAAIGAISAGMLSSFVLWRILIDPLRQVAESSFRIAQGRYGERVNVPENSGETIARLVINFNQMAENLEKVEEQRITLLGNISHELRTPLTGLKGYLEGVLDGLFPNDEETFGWMLVEVDRLSRLVKEIQELSRVEAGVQHYELKDFDIRGVAERVWSQMKVLADDKGVHLRLELPVNAVHVLADPDRTTQVIINLVNNALRHTPPGGEVTIVILNIDPNVEIKVMDTGEGIPEEVLPYIFERFYRVDQSRSRRSGGTGIGLTISQHLAWAMGGDLKAISAGKDQGSTFTFTLPLVGP